jgi:hypothetical protein
MDTIPTNGTFEVDGGNRLNTSTSNIDAGSVQFSFGTLPNISWWKGMKVKDNGGNEILLLETQDASHGPVDSQKYPVSSFGSTIEVEVWKAKTFGVHTDVGHVYLDTGSSNGHKITFIWQND